MAEQGWIRSASVPVVASWSATVYNLCVFLWSSTRRVYGRAEVCLIVQLTDPPSKIQAE